MLKIDGTIKVRFKNPIKKRQTIKQTKNKAHIVNKEPVHRKELEYIGKYIQHIDILVAP